MTTGASYTAAASPVVVVAPHFCVGHPVDLTIVRKMMTLSEGNFGVTDVDGNLMFKAQGKIFSLHDRRVLLDAARTPLITYKQKRRSAHQRWEAFRGESIDKKDMLFSVRKSSLFQMNTKLHVFMASNTSEDVCDFRIKGNWFESKCTIYAGNSNNIVAQMHRNHSAKSILLGKDNFGVTVYPNVDYAFIVLLVVILEEINTGR
ncbi:hypothetical protein ACP275_10G008200 [Erythranthe tilingii]